MSASDSPPNGRRPQWDRRDLERALERSPSIGCQAEPRPAKMPSKRVGTDLARSASNERNSGRARAVVALVSLLGVSLPTGPVAAQSASDLAQARSLYREGLSLEAAADWAGALAKFEAVAKVKLTPQVRFHVGRCKEHLGRLNEALGEYRLAEHEATQQKAKELSEISAAREALEAKIPKLVITRGQRAAGARVELDGVAVGETQIGTEVNVDPGPHRIVGRMPGGAQFENAVNVAEGETKKVELEPPEGAADNHMPPSAPPPAPVAEQGTAHVKGGPGALPFIIGGVGVASLVASGVFFVLRRGAEKDLEDGCRGDVCPMRLQDREDAGKRYTLLSEVTLGVGVFGVGFATVLLLTGGHGAEKSPPAQANRAGVPVSGIDVRVSRGFLGVNVAGAF